jgi:CHAD domain-containing protein
MKKLVKQLKQLQENLGDFNDLSVQQEFLVNHLGTLKPQTREVVLLSAAIGGLISRLETAHKIVRSQFFHVFETFNSPENQKRFKTLFAQ